MYTNTVRYTKNIRCIEVTTHEYNVISLNKISYFVSVNYIYIVDYSTRSKLFFLQSVLDTLYVLYIYIYTLT